MSLTPTSRVTTSVIRTLHPSSLALTGGTFEEMYLEAPEANRIGTTGFYLNNDFGGPKNFEPEEDGDLVVDATGDDLTFTFVAFPQKRNHFTIRFVDASAKQFFFLGANGDLMANFTLPDGESPTQGDSDTLTIDFGYAFVVPTVRGPGQMYGQVGEYLVTFLLQPSEYNAASNWTLTDAV
jgi:hypothetical protein